MINEFCKTEHLLIIDCLRFIGSDGILIDLVMSETLETKPNVDTSIVYVIVY